MFARPSPRRTRGPALRPGQSDNSLRRGRFARRRQRGGVAVEAAFSIMVLLLVLTGGINFGDAIVIRQRLTAATGRAARMCAVQNPGALAACVQQQINNELGQARNRCAPLNIEQRVVGVGPGLSMVQVDVSCQYAGGPWSGFLRQYVDEPLTLRARSSMPVNLP